MSEHPRARQTLVTLGIGLAVAGVGAALGVAAERLAMGRPVLPLGTGGEPDAEDYGDLHVPATVVTADDGALLHVEVEDADPVSVGLCGTRSGCASVRRPPR